MSSDTESQLTELPEAGSSDYESLLTKYIALHKEYQVCRKDRRDVNILFVILTFIWLLTLHAAYGG